MFKRNEHQQTVRKHLVYAFRHSFSSLDWRKFRNDLFIGTGIGLIGLVVSLNYGLSITADWDEHPVVLIVLACLPSSVLVADVAWRTFKALRKVYRERPHVQFRDVVHFSAAMLVGWSFIGCLVFWIYWVSSPHLRLWSGDVGGKGQKYKLIISEGLHLPHPNTTVFFQKVTMENFGIPTTIENWSMVVKLPDGEKIKAFPVLHVNSVFEDNNHNKSIYGSSISIFSETETVPVKKGKPVWGFAEFAIVGVRKETIRQIGTDLEIKYQDNQGHWYGTHQKVRAEEWTDSMLP
jgi:hypothetical protein